MHVSLWMALYLLVGAEPASADPSDANANVTEAERYADQAFQAYESKRYVEAVTLYLKAYASAPSAAILYNVARIYDVGLRDRPLAINFYRQYVSDPGAEPRYITSANERLLALRAAEEAAASSTSQATTVPPPMAAVAPHPSAARSVRGSPPADSARAESEPESERESTSSSSTAPTSLRTLAVISAVAAVAGIGIGTGFGIAAMSDASKAKDQCDGDRCSTQAGVDATHAATHKATVSTIGFAVGGAFVLTSAALWWLSGSGTSREEPRASVHVVPVAGYQFIGALVHGEL